MPLGLWPGRGAAKDYTLIWPGVVRAVNDFASGRALAVHFTPEVWWFVKPLEPTEPTAEPTALKRVAGWAAEA